MKLGLISDTHVPGAAPEPPPQVALAFEGVDLILHAGDIDSASCLDWLERIAPVLAVEMNPSFYWDGDARVAERRVVEVGGYAVGMVHELRLKGLASGAFSTTRAVDSTAGDSLPRALLDFFGMAVDIVVFGHTHKALVEVQQEVLFVNPGSATLPGHMRRLGTVGILELTPEGKEARIIDMAGLS